MGKLTTFLILALMINAANAGSLVVKPKAAAKFQPAVASGPAALKPPVMNFAPQVPYQGTPAAQVAPSRFATANTARPAAPLPQMGIGQPFAMQPMATSGRSSSSSPPINPGDLTRFLNSPLNDTGYGDYGSRRRYGDPTYRFRKDEIPAVATEDDRSDTKEEAATTADAKTIPPVDKALPPAAQQGKPADVPAQTAAAPAAAPPASESQPALVRANQPAPVETKVPPPNLAVTEPPKPAAPAVVNPPAQPPPEKKVEFPQCPKITTDPKLVQQMFTSILGIQDPLEGSLQQHEGEGFFGGRPVLRLVPRGTTKTDIIINHPEADITTHAKFCQNGNILRIRMDVRHDFRVLHKANRDGEFIANLESMAPGLLRSISDVGTEKNYTVQRATAGATR